MGRQVRFATWLAALALPVTSCSVERAALGPSEGAGDRMDAGRTDPPDGCVATAESCNELDDDCDGRIDEDFDLEADPTRCGSCDNACDPDPANGSSVCSGGSCVLACDRGWASCDEDPANGCEGELGTDSHCSMCGDLCGGGESCSGGTCVGCPAGCDCTGTCASGGSSCTCASGCTCEYDCGSDCTVTCDGSKCDVDAVDLGDDMTVTCEGGATCFFDGRGQSNVEGTCRGAFTECTFDCRPGPTEDTSNCKVIDCEMGASCAIRCGSTDAGNCTFQSCHAGSPTRCGEWVTCGTSCPP